MIKIFCRLILFWSFVRSFSLLEHVPNMYFMLIWYFRNWLDDDFGQKLKVFIVRWYHGISSSQLILLFHSFHYTIHFNSPLDMCRHMLCASSTSLFFLSFKFKYHVRGQQATAAKTNKFSIKWNIEFFKQIEVKFNFYHILYSYSYTRLIWKYLAFNSSFRTCNYVSFELIVCRCSLYCIYVSGWKRRKLKFLSF